MVVSAMEMLIGGVCEEDWGLLIGYNAQSVTMHYECPGILITQYHSTSLNNVYISHEVIVINLLAINTIPCFPTKRCIMFKTQARLKVTV
jgi:hypothetical protein